MTIDTFLFFNEIDLLEIRLAELALIVNHFVLIEASETFSGKSKPLLFAENRDEFARYPIEHVVIDKFPDAMTNPWQREQYSRNMIQERLRDLGCADTDIIMLSDIDEIPSTGAVTACAHNLVHEVPNTVYAFEQSLSYFHVKLFGR